MDLLLFHILNRLPLYTDDLSVCSVYVRGLRVGLAASAATSDLRAIDGLQQQYIFWCFRQEFITI
jgi:hypothetical protein